MRVEILESYTAWSNLLARIERQYQFKITKLNSVDMKIKAFKLRYCVYRNAGHIVAEDFIQPILNDKWDQHSIILGAQSYSQEFLGTLRITDTKPFGLPSHQLFHAIYPFNYNDALEISKFAVVRKHDLSRIVSFALTLKAAIHSLERKNEYWVMSTTPLLKRSFERFGAKLFEIPAQLRSISDIQKVCSNWKIFETYTEKYYYLKLSELSPSISRV